MDAGAVEAGCRWSRRDGDSVAFGIAAPSGRRIAEIVNNIAYFCSYRSGGGDAAGRVFEVGGNPLMMKLDLDQYSSIGAAGTGESVVRRAAKVRRELRLTAAEVRERRAIPLPSNAVGWLRAPSKAARAAEAAAAFLAAQHGQKAEDALSC